MRIKSKNNGSILIVVVFITAILATLAAGMLQMNAEEVQLMQHRVYAAQATALAKGALNEALAEIRQDSTWNTGIPAKEIWAGGMSYALNEALYKGGEYTVDVNDNNLSISASVISWQGYTATIDAEITVSDGNSPYIIRIDSMRIND